MTTQPKLTAPNPLTGGLTPIRYRNGRVKGGFVEAAGMVVKPGLAMAPHAENGERKTLRYLLVHAPSGYTLGATCCAAHITAAAEFAAGLPVDWTLDHTDLVAAVKATDMEAWRKNVQPCSDWCEPGDGPKTPSWGVRCHTCDWEWEDWPTRVRSTPRRRSGWLTTTSASRRYRSSTRRRANGMTRSWSTTTAASGTSRSDGRRRDGRDRD